MTNKELNEYFVRLAKVYLKNSSKDMRKLVESAIESGRDEFWGAVPWAFKEKHVTITTTESTETVDLPDDFEGIVSVIEKSSNTGFKLQKYADDEYDRLIPDSTSLNEGTPSIYKVYYDREENLWRLALYPTPSAAISLYLTYHTMSESGAIPQKYIGGLVAGIAQYLYVPGTPSWAGAHNAFLSQVERLKQVDNPDVGSVTRILDSSDVPTYSTDWFDEYVAGRL